MNNLKTLTVYNASAGSGKTYTLALKYISLALKGETFYNEETGKQEKLFSKNNYTHILAVTFTNKATAEMKGRILKYLFALANPCFRTPNDMDFLNKIVDETGLTDSEIAQRSADMLEAIMQDYDHFKVETIDSFFQTLLTSMAHEMNLPRGFKVDLDDKALVADAVTRFLTKLKSDNNSRGHDVMKRVTALLNDYIERKNKWDISKELTKFAQDNLFKDLIMNKEEELEAFMSGDANQFNALRTRLHDKMKEIDKDLKHRCEELKKLNEKILPFLNERYKTTLITYANCIIDHSLFAKEPATTITNLVELNLKNFVSKKFIDSGEAQANADINEVVRCVAELETLRKQYLKTYNTCELTLQKLSTLSLLSNINQEVKQLTAERGTHLLANTPKLFSSMVKKEDASFIYERLGTTLHHIMIDEFQDTSHSQWQNFKLLISEMLSQGQQCMLVGDIKQSIYRWRGGDWSILGGINTERGIGRYVNRLPKMVNYRSQPLIVRFNNAFFMKAASFCDCNSPLRTEGEVEWNVPQNWQEPIYEGELKNKFAKGENEETLLAQLVSKKNDAHEMTHGDNEQPILSMKHIYQDVVQIANKGGNEVGEPNGYVYIRLANKNLKNDEYDEQTLRELSQKIDLVIEKCKIEYKDMLILVRTNREAKKVIDYMQHHRADLPLTTEEAFMYSASDMVSCLVNALKFMNDIDVMKVAIAEEKMKVEKMKEKNEKYMPKHFSLEPEHQLSYFRLLQCYNNLMNEAKSKGDITDYAPALNAFIEQLSDERQRDEWHRIPLFELFQIFMRTLRFDEMNSKGQLEQAAYLYSFFDEVVAFVDEQTSDIAQFITYWDESLSHKSIATNASNAISVMTIHKAKGLERYTVFIPFTKMDLETDKTGSKPNSLTCDVTTITQNNTEAKDLLDDLPVIPITMGQKMNQSFYHDHYAYDHLQQRVENLNTLYVAFTRAGTNLFIWSNNKGKNEKNTAALLDAFVKNEQEKLDENETPYYDFGQLEERPTPPKANENSKYENVNPFDDDVKPHDEDVTLSPNNLSNIQFVQSKEAKDFLKGKIETKENKLDDPRERGKFYHDLLSRINTLDDLPNALNDMVDEGIITESEKQQHAAYVKKHIMSKPLFQKWFDGSYQLYNECNIYTQGADDMINIRRPDRVMINDHEVIIVDYKTGGKHDGYKSQVSEYRDLLHKLSGLPVKAYLWYLHDDKADTYSYV